MAERIGTRIDLRSDAVTLPTDEMFDAMKRARIGWAFRGEDPNVEQLERMGARVVGMEDAVYVPTGTMGNLVALMTHTQHGDQVVLEASAHILCCEQWGLASICGVLTRPIMGSFGVLDPDALEMALTQAPFRHVPRTSLVCLENTHNANAGAALSVAEISAVCDVAHRNGVPVHVDGARIFNAAASVGDSAAKLLAGVTSATINLNKGLSAPEGALLCGSREFIRMARVHRSRLGGVIGKAGISAAAGLVALRTMIPTVSEDNRRARILAEGLDRLAGIHVIHPPRLTNIVMAGIPGELGAERIRAELTARGIAAHIYDDRTLRFVTHRHISDTDIAETIEAMGELLEYQSVR